MFGKGSGAGIVGICTSVTLCLRFLTTMATVLIVGVVANILGVVTIIIVLVFVATLVLGQLHPFVLGHDDRRRL